MRDLRVKAMQVENGWIMLLERKKPRTQISSAMMRHNILCMFEQDNKSSAQIGEQDARYNPQDETVEEARGPCVESSPSLALLRTHLKPLAPPPLDSSSAIAFICYKPSIYLPVLPYAAKWLADAQQANPSSTKQQAAQHQALASLHPDMATPIRFALSKRRAMYPQTHRRRTTSTKAGLHVRVKG